MTARISNSKCLHTARPLDRAEVRLAGRGFLPAARVALGVLDRGMGGDTP